MSDPDSDPDPDTAADGEATAHGDEESAVTLGAGWGDRRTVAKTALAFLVAVVLVYLLGAVVGWDRTVSRLRTAQLEWVAAACVSTLLCLVAWGKTWHVVLRAIGVTVPFRKLIVTFFAATFANYVTPMGQAGGEPFIAYVLARDTEATFEQSLASVVTADLVRLLPFFTAGGLGLGYLLFTAQLAGPIERFAVLLAALAVGLPAIAVVGWRFRERLRDLVVRALAPVARRTDRLSLESVRDRITRLYGSLEVIADSPRVVVTAIAFAYVGWVLFAIPLYFAGLALGTPVSALLVCFLVPASVIAGSTPLPGGLAAIEGTLVALLTALTALATADALAVVAIYRLASYWLVIVVGGIAALWVIRRV
ncbi:lysylphosphatidylglycerol synthase transmembrane domain-containing protein [Natronobacterium haloterrestre]|uniref:lysylphosphatidylglycerol synthase transmembrane domain-containing protein n=1 Tax=Natronobacterium haloterrestre TaxID=148448 RepID=UPI000AEBE9A0|nr:flippase-like domain-containing protein [Halobiforma haloterrestris]